MNSGHLYAEMGRFEEWNWTRPQVIHVMNELARAHWEDEGERFGGFAAASAGLNIAIIADEGRAPHDTVAGILHHIGWLASYLTNLADDPDQVTALAAIIAATNDWAQ